MKHVIALALVAGLAGLGGPAHADNKNKTIIAPFDGSVSTYPSLPGELTDLLVAAAQAAKIKHTRGAIGLVELSLMANCSTEKPRCRKRLMATLQAKTLIAGSVSDDSGNVVVTIVKIERGGAVEITDHTLRGASAEELRDSFVPIAERAVRDEPAGDGATDPNATDPNATDPNATDPNATDPNATDPNATDPNATDPNATDPNATDPNATDPNATDPNATDPNLTENPVGPTPGEPGKDRLGGIRPWTLGLVGGGVALAAGGVITLVLAGNVQNDINEAPTDTPADLDALEDLESKGRFRYRLSYGLLAAGGVSVAAGVTLAILQRRERRQQRTVAVVPTTGGAAAFIGGSF